MSFDQIKKTFSTFALSQGEKRLVWEKPQVGDEDLKKKTAEELLEDAEKNVQELHACEAIQAVKDAGADTKEIKKPETKLKKLTPESLEKEKNTKRPLKGGFIGEIKNLFS